MSQFFVIHPETPQKRLIRRAVDIIDNVGMWLDEIADKLGWQRTSDLETVIDWTKNMLL